MFEQLRGRRPSLMEIDKYRKSAVVIPLILKEDGYEVLFEVRSSNLKKQPGEICLPGGGCEANEDAETSAVREICEELLIGASQIEIIAPMDMMVLPSNMIIYPFLGILKNYKGTYSTDEVQDVFSVPLKFFLENQPDCYYNQIRIKPNPELPWSVIPDGRAYPWSQGKYPVCFYRYEDYDIWGITARIMKNASELINESECKL